MNALEIIISLFAIAGLVRLWRGLSPRRDPATAGDPPIDPAGY